MSGGRAALAVSTWLRLARAHQVLLRTARDGVGPTFTLPQFDVCSQLARPDAADGLTATALSRALVVTAGNVTGIVDRLEARGFLRRTRDATDRRRARLALTAAGRTAWAGAATRHARALATTLAGVPLSELARLREGLGRLREATETRSRAGSTAAVRRG